MNKPQVKKITKISLMHIVETTNREDKWEKVLREVNKGIGLK